MVDKILKGTDIELDDQDEAVLTFLKRVRQSDVVAAFFVYAKVNIPSSYKELKKYVLNTKRATLDELVEICGVEDYQTFAEKTYSSLRSEVMSCDIVEPKKVVCQVQTRKPETKTFSNLEELERNALRHSQFFYPVQISVTDKERTLLSDLSPFIHDIPILKLSEVYPSTDISLLTTKDFRDLGKETDLGITIPFFEEPTEDMLALNLKFPVVDLKIKLIDSRTATISYCSLDSIVKCFEFYNISCGMLEHLLKIESREVSYSREYLYLLIFTLLRRSSGSVRIGEHLTITFQYNPEYYFIAYPKTAYVSCKEDVLRKCMEGRIILP